MLYIDSIYKYDSEIDHLLFDLVNYVSNLFSFVWCTVHCHN